MARLNGTWFLNKQIALTDCQTIPSNSVRVTSFKFTHVGVKEGIMMYTSDSYGLKLGSNFDATIGYSPYGSAYIDINDRESRILIFEDQEVSNDFYQWLTKVAKPIITTVSGAWWFSSRLLWDTNGPADYTISLTGTMARGANKKYFQSLSWGMDGEQSIYFGVDYSSASYLYGWESPDDRYIDFGDEEQQVSLDFAIFLMENAEPIAVKLYTENIIKDLANVIRRTTQSDKTLTIYEMTEAFKALGSEEVYI